MTPFVRVALVMLVALGWSIAWYWTTTVEVAGIWWRSDTYAHGLIVLPVVAWLAWRARWRMVGLAPQPVWWVSFAVLAAGGLWFAGELVAVAAASHAGLVLTVIFACVAMLGRKLARVLLFPLLFMLFAIPIGDFLLPALMEHTADFTVAALRLSGVPVYQEGLHFVVPNGRWSVVEACSGIRYLIASLLVGALFAYLNYNSLRKRLAFMAFAFVMPIFANWVRAYLIVMLGYLSDNEIATGVDHLIYGWVFFGVIIMVMFLVGQRWSDPPPARPQARAVEVPFDVRAATLPVVAIAVSIMAFPLLERATNPEVSPFTVAVQAPMAAPGWQLEAPTHAAGYYRPSYTGFRGEAEARYVSAGGTVSLHTAFYARQHPGYEMIAWGNGIVPGEGTRYNLIDRGLMQTAIGPVRLATITGDTGRVAVAHWYLVGDALLTSDVRTKLALAADRLRGGMGASMVVVISTPVEGDADQQALSRLAAFIDAHAGAFSQRFDEARREASR